MADRDQIMQALRNAHTAGDTAGASRLAKMWQDAGGETAQPRENVIATTQDGGRIIDMGDGQRAYASAGYSTTEPAKIDELMQGATPVEITQRDFDQERIAQAPVGARAASVAQGLPFVGSYVDEAFGGGRGDNIRQLQGAMQRENPIETGALNLAGGVVGSIPMAMAAAPAVAAAAPTSTAGLAMSGLALGSATGAAEGLVYGAGDQSGAGRAANAATGGFTGGVVGGALGVAAPYAARGISNVIQRLKSSDLQVIARELDVSPQAAATIRDTLRNGSEADAMAALQRAGPNAMLADAGRASSDLLDAAAQSGGNASQITQRAMQERTQAATATITGALDKTLGAPQGERALIDAVRTGTAPARSAAYNAAYAAPIDYASAEGRKLESLMPRIPAAAWRRASQLMELDGDKSLQQLFTIADNGSVSVQTMPDVRQLDYITRALNDVAAEADGAGKLGGTTDLGRATGNLSKSVRQTVRGAVPEYGTALDTAADAISERNAIETGYTLLRSGTRTDDVRAAIGNTTSAAERNAAKQGVRAYLDDTMGNVTRTLSDPDTSTREGIRALRDMSSRSNQTKLRILLGQDAADELLGEVDQAATAFELRAAIAENSKTARRQSIQIGVNTAADGGVLRTLASGEPVSSAKLLVQALTGETAEAVELRRMGIYEDIAKALTGVRGSQAQAALARINSAMNGQPMSEASARMVANTLTSGGVLLGSHEAQTRLSRQ
jgi:hypothetical protein